MGGGGYVQFAVNRAGGLLWAQKRGPIEKIEIDGDKVLGGRHFFLSNKSRP
jgi:hypothetical protein